jgi:hypothetical protein
MQAHSDAEQIDAKPLGNEVLVRSYGAKLLGGPAAYELAMDVLDKKNRLWNQLVEVGRTNRANYEALLESNSEFFSLKNLILQERLTKDSLVKELKGIRSKARSKSTPEEARYKELIASVNIKIKALSPSLKEARIQARTTTKEALLALNEATKSAVNSSVRASGLWTCHKEDIKTRFAVAFSRSLKEKTSLNFKRFEGTGGISLRLTADWLLSDVMAGSTSYIRWRKPTAEELGPMLTSVKFQRMVAEIRIGARGETGLYPTLKFLVTLRPGHELSSRMNLRYVRVGHDGSDHQKKWAITFTFTLPRTEPDGIAHELPATAIGLNFGWSMVVDPDHQHAKVLRVATVHDGERVHYLNLPASFLTKMQRADDLQADLQRRANDFFPIVKQILTNTTDPTPEVPSRFWKLAKRVSHGRTDKASLGQLLAFCDAHLGAGMPLGIEASATLQNWSRQVSPLRDGAFFVRRQALRWRKNFYRVFASGLVSRAGLLGLDGVALDELAKMKSPEKENPLHERARRQRVWASCYELRLCIVTAAKREGRFIAITDPTDKTRTCSSCGHVHGAIDEILFVCDGCGKFWDRDENAALNHRFSAMSTQESTYTSTS